MNVGQPKAPFLEPAQASLRQLQVSHMCHNAHLCLLVRQLGQGRGLLGHVGQGVGESGSSEVDREHFWVGEIGMGEDWAEGGRVNSGICHHILTSFLALHRASQICTS